MDRRSASGISAAALPAALLTFAGCGSSTSSEIRCGDGDRGEQCDDGNLVDDDGCSAACRSAEQCVPAFQSCSFDAPCCAGLACREPGA